MQYPASWSTGSGAGTLCSNFFIVPGNTATSRQSLSGWRLIDRNGRVTVFDVEVDGPGLRVATSCAGLRRLT